MGHQILRSVGLSSIPERKIIDALEQTIRNCHVCSTKPNVKLDHGLCDLCRLNNKRIRRYAEANIPVIYWGLEMELNFHGDPSLKEKYLEITEDLRKSYKEGVAICFAGGHGRGKMLSLDTELPTPNGFVKLSNLKQGDELFDDAGNVCTVVQLHPIDEKPKSYKVVFDDQSEIDACADHLWSTQTRKERKNRSTSNVRTTEEMFRTLRVGGKQEIANHSIPCSKHVNYSPKQLPIDPYVLGCWLGDGSTIEGSIKCADQEILDQIFKSGYEYVKIQSNNLSKSQKYRLGNLIVADGKKIGLLTHQLKKNNLIGNKHIPIDYQYNSYELRLSLLQGLMDTDGSCSINGRMEYTSVIESLAKQVYQLVCSLGIKATIHENKSLLYGKQSKNRFRVMFTTQLPVFRLNRKLNRIKLNKSQLSRTTHRFVVNIIPIKSMPMRCITVDSPSHLFLVTKSFIPTHNTMTCCNILKRAVEKNFSGLYVNLNDIVSTMLNRDSEDRGTARRELLMVDYLVIDEFDSRYMSNDKASDLFGKILEEVFRTRSQNSLPILMCTNDVDVKKSFTGAIKESIDSLMSTVKTVPVLGKDQRIVNASKGKK